MKLALVCITSLAATALLLPTANAEAGTCVNYLYIADYHWYYACADPKDASCAVYTAEQHGAAYSEQCYGVDVMLGGTALCTPETGDLDHRWSICAAADTDCPVYQRYQSGSVRCLA